MKVCELLLGRLEDVSRLVGDCVAKVIVLVLLCFLSLVVVRLMLSRIVLELIVVPGHSRIRHDNELEDFERVRCFGRSCSDTKVVPRRQ